MDEFAKKMSIATSGMGRLAADIERASTNLEEYSGNLLTGPMIVGSDFKDMVGKTFSEASQEERDTYMMGLKIAEDTEQKIVRLFD